MNTKNTKMKIDEDFIYKMCSYYANTTTCIGGMDADEQRDEISVWKSDYLKPMLKQLEMLDIVKKYIQQFHLPANEDRVEYIDSISFELSTDALTKEEIEDYNKIKEWLNND